MDAPEIPPTASLRQLPPRELVLADLKRLEDALDEYHERYINERLRLLALLAAIGPPEMPAVTIKPVRPACRGNIADAIYNCLVKHGRMRTGDLVAEVGLEIGSTPGTISSRIYSQPTPHRWRQQRHGVWELLPAAEDAVA